MWELADVFVDDGPGYGDVSAIVNNLGTSSITIATITSDAPGFSLLDGGASLPYILLPGMSYAIAGSSSISTLSGFELLVVTAEAGSQSSTMSDATP